MLDLGTLQPDFWDAVKLFFALAIGHALADFPLQGEYIARFKSRHARPVDQETVPSGLWVHCMTAHCLIHAGFVWLITGQVIFAIVEFVLHFILDFLKCEGKTSFNFDQIGHYTCKLAYALIFWLGWLT